MADVVRDPARDPRDEFEPRQFDQLTRGLKSTERRIVELKFKQEWKHKEIAELLGVSESRISQRVNVILGKIRQRLEGSREQNMEYEMETRNCALETCGKPFRALKSGNSRYCSVACNPVGTMAFTPQRRGRGKPARASRPPEEAIGPARDQIDETEEPIEEVSDAKKAASHEKGERYMTHEDVVSEHEEEETEEQEEEEEQEETEGDEAEESTEEETEEDSEEGESEEEEEEPSANLVSMVQLALETGVSAVTLRKYEIEGIISPIMREGRKSLWDVEKTRAAIEAFREEKKRARTEKVPETKVRPAPKPDPEPQVERVSRAAHRSQNQRRPYKKRQAAAVVRRGRRSEVSPWLARVKVAALTLAASGAAVAATVLYMTR